MSLSLDGDIHSCSRTSLLNCADYRGSHTGQGELELPILHVRCPPRENVCCCFNIAKKGSSFGSRVNEVSHVRDFVLFCSKDGQLLSLRCVDTEGDCLLVHC